MAEKIAYQLALALIYTTSRYNRHLIDILETVNVLPLIDGPCLVRDAIPLNWEVAATEPANDWEMSRYLQVLAEFEQPCDVLDERPSSAKLDLTLLWLARSLNTHMPQPTSATLGLEQLVWRSQQAHPVQQTGFVAFCLSAQFPLLLKFPAQITACIANDESYLIHAHWLPMSAGLLDSFEKTIFRYHRRHISQLRGNP